MSHRRPDPRQARLESMLRSALRLGGRLGRARRRRPGADPRQDRGQAARAAAGLDCPPARQVPVALLGRCCGGSTAAVSGSGMRSASSVEQVQARPDRGRVARLAAPRGGAGHRPVRRRRPRPGPSPRCPRSFQRPPTDTTSSPAEPATATAPAGRCRAATHTARLASVGGDDRSDGPRLATRRQLSCTSSSPAHRESPSASPSSSASPSPEPSPSPSSSPSPSPSTSTGTGTPSPTVSPSTAATTTGPAQALASPAPQVGNASGGRAVRIALGVSGCRRSPAHRPQPLSTSAAATAPAVEPVRRRAEPTGIAPAAVRLGRFAGLTPPSGPTTRTISPAAGSGTAVSGRSACGSSSSARSPRRRTLATRRRSAPAR